MLSSQTLFNLPHAPICLILLLLVGPGGCSAFIEFKPPLARSSESVEIPEWNVTDHSTRVAINPSDAPAPTTEPTQTPAPTLAAAVAGPGDLKLDDAPPIDHVIRATSAQQVEFVRMLQPVDGRAIYFGHAVGADPQRARTGATGAAAATRTTPIIATRSADRWRAMEIADERIVDANWVFVAAGPQRGHAWGVLEGPPRNDGAAPYLLLVHTDDSGATWRTIPLLKPSASARYDSICMGPNRGRVTVYQPPGESIARPGFYHYHTNDRGTTWATPTYEPDALTPADLISEFEQPPFRRDPPSRAANAK